MHFYPHLCTHGKTFQLVTHPEISLGQVCLTLEFFICGFFKKKVYLNDMNILSIILSLKSECHNPPLRRPTSPSVNPKSRISPLDYVCTSSTDIHIPYIQLAACIPYHVPPRGLTRHTYVPTSLNRMLPYPF
jgi:hypothetical protein